MKRVSVAVICRINGSGEKEYLLMSTKSQWGDKTGFLQPASGHIEGEESEEDCLRREIAEELGVGVVVNKKLAELPGDVPDYMTYWWNCSLLSFDFSLQEEEVGKIYWLTKKEVVEKENVWPATRKFFQEYLED